MARTHRTAAKLAQAQPALHTASVITGLLLQLPRELRPQILQLVERQLVLAASLPLLDDEPGVLGAGIMRTGLDDGPLLPLDDGAPLRLHDAGDNGE